MGRRRKSLPANGMQIIRDLASNGVQETVLAKALGIDVKTWRAIRTEDPDARAAWEEAKALEQDKLVGMLFDQAVGKPAEFDDRGNQLRAERAPHPASAMFLLKTRHGYRELGPADGEGDARVAVQINIPAPLRPEEYAKLVSVTPLPALSNRAEAA